MKPFLLPLLATLLTLAIAAPGAPVAAKEKPPISVEEVPFDKGGVDLWVTNNMHGDATVELDLSLMGMDVIQQQRRAVLPAQKRLLMARLKPSPNLRAARSGRRESWWQYEYSFQPGRRDAQPRETVYLLPYAKGTSAQLRQGYTGANDRIQKHSLDFKLPEGTAVRAARAGMVMRTVTSFTKESFAMTVRDRGNLVQIQHDDGTIGGYYHLAPGGARVKGGQSVAAGQVIGLSGRTGFAPEPHLYFEVTVPVSARASRTLPTRFKTATGVTPGQALVKGRRYVAL